MIVSVARASISVLRRSSVGGSAAIMTALLLGGCAGVSTDPHTGGLAGGIRGLATGAYDQRVAVREASLQSLEDAEAGLVRRIGVAGDRLKVLDRQMASRKSALQKLKLELDEIDRTIALVRQSIAVGGGIDASVRAANDRKASALKPLQAQRDLVKRMTDELEANERQEAINYEQLKGGAPDRAAPPDKNDTSIAAFEARGRAADTKKAEAEELMKNLKVQVAQLGN